MFWPDTGTGVDVQPERKAVQSAGRKFFTEGGVGVPSTVPGGDWFNQITNELLNVLSAAGIDPSKADDDQLLQAIVTICAPRLQARFTASEICRSLGKVLASGSFQEGSLLPSEDYLLFDSDGYAIYQWAGIIPLGGLDVPAGTDPLSSSDWHNVTLTRPFFVIYPPILPSSEDVTFDFNPERASFRYGISDAFPLDDPKSHFRGLPDKNTWKNPLYQGVGSYSSGRNGAAYAYLSACFGHDCINYGAASFSFGAGSATGNPDAPGDDASFGYCAFGAGKYSQAKGRISFAFGEDCIAGADNSIARGTNAITGPCVAGMPNPIGAGPVISDGIGSVADGEDVEAFGDGSRAVGRLLKAYNGAHAYGYGINLGSRGVNAVPGSVALFCNSDVPAEIITPAPGTNGGFSRYGRNTAYPNERFESVMKNGDKVVYRLDELENEGFFELQCTTNGDFSPVFRIHWKRDGTAEILINGQPVIKNRAAAIPDAATTDVKVQAILDTLRYHGLIGQ